MTAPSLPMGGDIPVTPDEIAVNEAVRQALAQFGIDEEQAANVAVEGNPPDPEMPRLSPDEEMRRLQRAMYGDDFPMASDDPEERTDPRAWARWVRGRWDSRREAVQMHLHLVERNRLFRAGQQWISAAGNGPWREPTRPRDAARVVYNIVDKALDQRLQILTEQRPGFSVTPQTQQPKDRRRAQAHQVALEYQYNQMQMDRKAREAGYWAQTDGVSFLHLYWNPDRGPWDERVGSAPGERRPMGDLDCQVLRVEQVRVSANATSTEDPHWMVIRETITRAEAVWRWGLTGLDASDVTAPTTSGAAAYAGSEGVGAWVLSQTVVGEGQRLREELVVDKFTCYVQPHPEALPNGLHVIVVGDTVVFGPGDLLWNVIPVVRLADGSSDPSYYPRPVVEQWLDHQMRINAVLSKWVENVRVNAGGRFLARPNALSTETLIGGVTSLIEVRGAGSMDDVVRPVQGFSVGNDVKELLSLEIKAFEDATGWNAMSRGQVSGESGRAIIATREQLERVFSPAVAAMARAFTDWARIAIAGMAWGYMLPRALGVVGLGRPDLAAAISAEDLDGVSDVRVEPATLMPMPMAFRLYLLDNWLQAGIIDAKEYRRRLQFAVATDIATPDEDQEARAKRVAYALRQLAVDPETPVPPMRWQDNEAIHQDVLDREILLQDDLPDFVVQAAEARWGELAAQAQQKAMAVLGGGMPAEGAMPDAPDGPAAASVPNLPPETLPLAANNPPIGVAGMLGGNPGGATDPVERAAQQADALTAFS
jgi:hypothetical protein